MNRVENQLSLFPSLSLSLSFSLFLSLSLVSNMAPESGRFSIESEMHQAVALERPPRIDGQFPLWHHHPFRQDLKGKIYGGRPRLAFSFYTNIYIYIYIYIYIFVFSADISSGQPCLQCCQSGLMAADRASPWALFRFYYGQRRYRGRKGSSRWVPMTATSSFNNSNNQLYSQLPSTPEPSPPSFSSTPSPSAPHCCHRNRHHNLAVMSPFLIYELTRFNGFAASAKKERKCSNFINKGFKVFIQILQLRFGNHSFFCCCCCCCCSCCWRSRLLDL